MPLGPVASNEMWDEIYDRLVALVEQHRSTLVFVNTRRMAERVAHNLGERIGEENVAAHHGSLSRKLRLAAEKKLKEGQVRVLVATASLELGIDVGTVDLVVQINSPRAIAVALQRVGRSGHWRGAVPKGRLFCTTRDDLLECAALVRAIRQGDLDRLMIPESPLDVLAQQIVAACCGGEEWEREMRDCLRLVTAALSVSQSGRALTSTVDSGDAVRGHCGEARTLWRISASRSSERQTARAARGAAGRHHQRRSDSRQFALHRSRRAGWHCRGNSRRRFRRREQSRRHHAAGQYVVDDSPHRNQCRPRAGAGCAWRAAERAFLARRSSGAHGRTFGACWNAAGKNQRDAAAHFAGGIFGDAAGGCARGDWLKDECGLDDSGAEQAIEYILQGRAVLGAVPTQTTVIAERFFDEGGGMQLVIHAPFGGRINKAWGLALRKRFCVGFNFELQAAATDNGLNIASGRAAQFSAGDVFHFLQAETVQPILEQAALDSPIFATRWRWDANRALALLRFQNGKKVPPQIQRMRSRRSAGLGFSRCGGLLRKYSGRAQDSRSSAGERSDERCAHRGDGYGWAEVSAAAGWRMDGFVVSRSIRRCRRSFRTRF